MTSHAFSKNCSSVESKNEEVFSQQLPSSALAIVSSPEKGVITKANIALVCGLNFQFGCQDRLRVNLDADQALS